MGLTLVHPCHRFNCSLLWPTSFHLYGSGPSPIRCYGVIVSTTTLPKFCQVLTVSSAMTIRCRAPTSSTIWSESHTLLLRLKCTIYSTRFHPLTLNITRHVLSFLNAQISSLTAPVIPSQPPTRSEWTLEGNIVVYSIGPSAKPTGYGLYFPHVVSSLSFTALLGSLPITSQFVTKTSS